MLFSAQFKEKFKLYYTKLLHSKGSVHSIAMGVAIGVFMSVAVPLGQIFVAIPLAFIFRAHRGMAILFTFVSNPYTTPVLYPAACLIGAKILGVSLTFAQIQNLAHAVIASFNFSGLSAIGWKLFISFMVGGPILGILMAIPGYFISYYVVSIYRKRKTHTDINT